MFTQPAVISWPSGTRLNRLPFNYITEPYFTNVIAFTEIERRGPQAGDGHVRVRRPRYSGKLVITTAVQQTEIQVPRTDLWDCISTGSGSCAYVVYLLREPFTTSLLLLT